MTILLRNYDSHCDDGEAANVSGLNTFSVLNADSPNQMPSRRGRRRNNDAISPRRPEEMQFLVEEVGGILRKSHCSRLETGSSNVRVRNERTAVTASRERRCVSNSSWLHDGGGVSYSFSSSSTSLSFYDNLDWPIFMFILTLFFTVADACSTRPSPKPRPPRPIWTPDIGHGVVKENCTDDYAELYCMNSGKCYRQKILETFIVSCECLPGYVGTRCQYRDVPDKYLPVHQRIETASIAGGVTVLIIIVTVFSMLAWLYYRRRRVFTHSETSADLPAGCV